jgi:hypothetical protein
MTRTITRSALLLGLGLTLTACAQHGPRQANCFDFRDAPAPAGTATTTISTKGTAVRQSDIGCEFVVLGEGG